MPIYLFQCPDCNESKEILLPMADRDTPIVHCQTPMVRKISLPILVNVKQSGREMALDMLNSKESTHMKPETKQAAFQGTLKKDKSLF